MIEAIIVLNTSATCPAYYLITSSHQIHYSSDLQPLHQLSWVELAPDCQQSRNVLNIQIFQFQYAETVGGRRRKCLENIWKLFWWHVVYEINWCCQPCETCACSAILCTDMTTQSFHWPTKQQHALLLSLFPLTLKVHDVVLPGG